jgi:hypothetical protein
MKRLLRVTSAAAFLLAPSTGQAADAVKPSDFALRVPLMLAQPAGLHVLELTEPIYLAGTSRTLADLHIFNAKGEALPWAELPVPPFETKPGAAPELMLVPLPAQQDMRTLMLKSYAAQIELDGDHETAEITPLRPAEMPPDAVGGLLIDARRAEGRHGRLTLRFDVSGSDYERIEILGSDDLVSWRPLATGLVRNRKLGPLVEPNTFDLNRPPLFLRIHWTGDTAPQLTSARFSESPLSAPTLPRASLTVFADPDDRDSLLVDVPRALPIERLYFRPSSVNESFTLEVYQRVEGVRVRSNSGSRWSRWRTVEWFPVGRVDVVHVVRHGTELLGEPLPFAGNTDRLRLRWIGPPANPPMVDAEWQPARIAFLARVPGPYFLAIGNTKAKQDQALDLGTVLQGTDRFGTGLPVARMTIGDAEQRAAQAVGQQRLRQIAKETARSRLVLWSVLLTALMVLAWMAWRLSLQLRRENP